MQILNLKKHLSWVYEQAKYLWGSLTKRGKLLACGVRSINSYLGHGSASPKIQDNLV